MLSAEQLLVRGREAGSGGRLAQARADLTKAAQRATDPDVAARVHVTSAYVVAESGDPHTAEKMCRDVLAAQNISDRARGLAWSQLGLLRLRAGDLDHGARCFDQAIAMLEESADRGFALLNAGNIALQRGQLSVARVAFIEAQALFGTTNLPVEEAKAGHNLAYVDLLTGDLPAALLGMERHRGVLAAQGAVSLAIGEQDRAEVLMAAGLADEADEALERAAKAFGSRGLRQFQGESELVRARALLLDDPQKARRVAAAAARRFRSRGSLSWALRADALVLMAQVEAGGRAAALAAKAEDLAARLRENGLASDAVTVAVYGIRVMLRRGNRDQAAARLSRVRLPESVPLPTRLLVHEVRGDLAKARGARSRALNHVRAGLADLHAWQSSFGSLDLQSSLVVHGRQLGVDGLNLALASGDPELVFEWSERGRTLVNRVAPVRPPDDPIVAAELAELRYLSTLRPDPRSADGLRLARLRVDVRQHAWAGAGSGEITEPIAMGDLKDELAADDAALVAYVGAEGRLVALVVTGRDAVLLDLGDLRRVDLLLDGLHADLDMAATDLPDGIRAVVTTSANAGLADLARRLVTPIESAIGDRRVVITPSTILSRTPWSLLPGLEGRPVAVPQSATRWLTTHRSPSVPATRAHVGFVAGPGVARADAEVRDARRIWGRGTVLTGTEASVAAATTLAETTDVLHFAAHGRHATDNAMFSGLELADGPFFGYDIDRIRAVPETVLLSACEVGRSTVRSGEETVGMTAAWLHAGAGSVIASSALIGDSAAADVLARVHAGLAGGATPAEALAEAQAASDALAPLVCFGAGW